MDIFNAFELTDYTFLQISRGSVTGNVIVSETPAQGVFKLRSGMLVSGDQETRQSDSTLHVRPCEPFIAANGSNLVGHGIRCQGKDYEIKGQSAGSNFDTGEVEHYRLTLGAADFSGMGAVNVS